MPFDCSEYPSVIKCRNDESIIICYKKNYCLFNIYSHYITYNIERIIWIGFYKNKQNSKCLINKLAKDLIIYILYFLGKKQLMVSPYIKIDI